MTHVARRWSGAALALAIAGCGGRELAEEPLLPAETFTWLAQPIAFAPPPAQRERQGDGGAGTIGVRFILRGGGGQCISVAAFRLLAERDRRPALERLLAEHDDLSRREFLRELSLARARTDDPISDRESEVARAINAALDRAQENYLGDRASWVASDLRAALRAASAYQPTLDELLPHIRLRPERMQEPERWRIGYERDTTLAGLPAFASDDTLIAPEQTLLYHEVFWAVNGCAFKLTFQGLAENLSLFHRIVDSVHFPEPSDAPTR
jgi:hypothetical protein